MHMCPVCGYKGLKRPPENHEICPCCGTQFGYSDVGPGPKEQYHTGLREYWVNHGSKWQSRAVAAPPMWNADQQLIDANLSFALTWPKRTAIKFEKTPITIGQLIPAS